MTTFSSRIGMGLGVVTLALSGCLGQYWDRYALPDYGSDRANRICHPFGQCEAGDWVATDQARDVVDVALQSCRTVQERRGNGWYHSSVTEGLEVGRCMKAKGYVLRVSDPNPVGNDE